VEQWNQVKKYLQTPEIRNGGFNEQAIRILAQFFYHHTSKMTFKPSKRILALNDKTGVIISAPDGGCLRFIMTLFSKYDGDIPQTPITPEEQNSILNNLPISFVSIENFKTSKELTLIYKTYKGTNNSHAYLFIPFHCKFPDWIESNIVQEIFHDPVHQVVTQLDALKKTETIRKIERKVLREKHKKKMMDARSQRRTDNKSKAEFVRKFKKRIRKFLVKTMERYTSNKIKISFSNDTFMRVSLLLSQLHSTNVETIEMTLDLYEEPNSQGVKKREMFRPIEVMSAMTAKRLISFCDLEKEKKTIVVEYITDFNLALEVLTDIAREQISQRTNIAQCSDDPLPIIRELPVNLNSNDVARNVLDVTINGTMTGFEYSSGDIEGELYETNLEPVNYIDDFERRGRLSIFCSLYGVLIGLLFTSWFTIFAELHLEKEVIRSHPPISGPLRNIITNKEKEKRMREAYSLNEYEHLTGYVRYLSLPDVAIVLTRISSAKLYAYQHFIFDCGYVNSKQVCYVSEFDYNTDPNGPLYRTAKIQHQILVHIIQIFMDRLEHDEYSRAKNENNIDSFSWLFIPKDDFAADFNAPKHKINEYKPLEYTTVVKYTILSKIMVILYVFISIWQCKKIFYYYQGRMEINPKVIYSLEYLNQPENRLLKRQSKRRFNHWKLLKMQEDRLSSSFFTKEPLKRMHSLKIVGDTYIPYTGNLSINEITTLHLNLRTKLSQGSCTTEDRYKPKFFLIMLGINT
jgi:hypothetical protein